MSRIALAGFLHESNTFLPVPTTYEDFASTSLTVEDEVLDRWHGANHELGGMVDGAAAEGLTLEPLLATFAVPSGTLTAEAFERIADGILSRLAKSLPVDGLLVALHGATVAAGQCCGASAPGWARMCRLWPRSICTPMSLGR